MALGLISMKDEDGIESIADDYRNDPLNDVPTMEADAGRSKQGWKAKPSLLNKVEGKVNELTGRYSSYQNLQKERAKEKAMKNIARAKEERSRLVLEKEAAKENILNAKLKEETKALNKQCGASGGFAGAIGAFRSFQSSRKAFRGNDSNKGGNTLLSGGLGKGSGLLSQGLGNRSSLLSGGLGGKNKMLMGGVGGHSKLLSGGMGKSKLSLSLGKGKGLRL